MTFSLSLFERTLRYVNVATMSTQYICPLLLLLICNGAVVIVMRRSARTRALLTTRAQCEHQVTRMMVIVVIGADIVGRIRSIEFSSVRPLLHSELRP